MKAIYITLVVCLFMIPANVKSQERTIGEQVTGEWLMDFDKTMENINSYSRAHLDTIQVSRRERLEKLYRGRKVTYAPEGDYNRLLADGRSVTGSWKLISDDTQIEITGPDGESKLYLQIEQLKARQLVLRPIVDQDKKMTIPVWYYTKVKN